MRSVQLSGFTDTLKMPDKKEAALKDFRKIPNKSEESFGRFRVCGL